MRTGILGGTFNPPHLGHLHAAELAHRALNLDRVLFIPTNIPPHKVLPENTASAEDRCEMVRRLTAEKPWAMLDTIEIDRGGASYTVDTLRALHARGETDLRLMVKSPRAYIDSRFDFKKPGKLNTFKHYFKIGGLPLVWRVLTYQRAYGDNPHPDDVPAAQ